MKIKKVFLIFAFTAVLIIALLYGVDPQWFGQTFLNIPALDPNIAHILRAVMGLYIALGLFWLYAVFHPIYINQALITVILFSGGLVTGRIISLFIEGQPSPLLTLYILMEFLLTPIAFWVYKIKD